MHDLDGSIICWGTAACIILVLIIVIYQQINQKPNTKLSSNMMSKEGLVEFLVHLGYNEEDAEHRIEIAISKKPDGNENELVNIAIKVEDETRINK
tara:strand:+ start:33 stop:320 length:288 start_codon:yes stop_codon:yes gene_type:complete